MAHILADTHIILWALLDDPRLPPDIRDAMMSENRTWICHQTSVWEIQIKYDAGKLQLPGTPRDFLRTEITKAGFVSKGIEDEAIFLLGKLPPIHRDPFDRLLVAHAILNGWSIATTDPVVLKYPVSVFSG